MRRIKPIWWIVAGVAAVLPLCAWLLIGFGAPPPELPWPTLTLTAGEQRSVVHATGQLDYALVAPVYALTGGVVQSAPREAGSLISSGELLAVLGNETLTRELQQTADALQTLQVSLAVSARDLPAEIVRAPVAGRVAELRAQAGDAMADGVWILIATDGAYEVAFEAPGWSGALGDNVSLLVEGQPVTGLAVERESTLLIVRLSDDGLALGQIAQLLNAEGEVEADGALSIETPSAVWGVAGVVAKVHVQPGDWVEAEDPLLTLTAPLTAEGLEGQLLQYEQLQRSLNAGRRMAEELSVFAPADGLLLELDLVPGQTVAAGEVIAFIAEPMTRQVTLYVSERDVVAILPGQEVMLSFPALPELTAWGWVDSVVRQDSLELEGPTYGVTLSIPYAQGMLPGMSVSGEIHTGSLQDVCLVPEKAIYVDQGATYLLRAPEPGSLPRTWLRGPVGRLLRPSASQTLETLLPELMMPVVLGQIRDGQAAIEWGAQPGDTVVLWGDLAEPIAFVPEQ